MHLRCTLRKNFIRWVKIIFYWKFWCLWRIINKKILRFTLNKMKAISSLDATLQLILKSIYITLNAVKKTDAFDLKKSLSASHGCILKDLWRWLVLVWYEISNDESSNGDNSEWSWHRIITGKNGHKIEKS